MNGKELSTVRGREIRKPPHLVPVVRLIYVDHTLKYLCENVSIFADVFFVNGIPFLLTTSENIGMMSSESLPNRKKETTKLLNGLEIQQLDTDLQFRCVEDEVMALVNLCDENLHVHPPERAIRVVK